MCLPEITPETVPGPGVATGEAARHNHYCICDLHSAFNNSGFITSHFSGTSLGLNFILTVFALYCVGSGEGWKGKQETHISFNYLQTSSR